MLRLTDPRELEVGRGRWMGFVSDFAVPLAWSVGGTALVVTLAEGIRYLSGRWF